MSSYHSSFTYNGKNSATDYCLVIAAFEPDEGFTDTFLAMENVSDDYYDRTKRFDYGARYSNQAEIKITFIKHDRTDMTLNEFRACAKWLTGARVNSWMDMYAGKTFVYSFLGKFINFEHYKLDGRIIGCRATFSSVSPWAYSAPQYFDCDVYRGLYVNDNGVLCREDQNMNIVDDGVLCAGVYDKIYFGLLHNGTAYWEPEYRAKINNESDDLYTYIYLDIDYANKAGTSLSIKNATIGEESIINNMSKNETITISAKQFITSNIPNKIFGDDFNFIWPRLQPGENDFIIAGNGRGTAHFAYRYPMKVGDCAMDISVYGGEAPCCECGETPTYNTVRWEDVIGAPTTIGGYGITDAYTASEIDDKIENIDIEWGDIKNTPTTVEGYEISNAYTKSEVYTKTEVDDKIDNIEVSGGGGGSANVDEEELNSMLNDILGT